MFGRQDYVTEIEKLTSRISELEEKQANLRLLDEAVRRNMAMFEALVANSSEGIALTGPDRRIVKIVKAVLGYDPADLSGAPFDSILHVEDADILVDCYVELLSRRSTSIEFEGRFRRPDGSYGWLRAKLTDMLDDPDVQAIVCNYTDITRHKQHDLMAAEFAAIVESADQAIFSKDLDGNILTWNQGAQRQYGYSSEEVAGRHVWMLVPPEFQEEEQRSRKRVQIAAQPLRLRTLRVRKDGLRIPVLVQLAPVLDRYGRTRGISHSSLRLLDATSLPDATEPEPVENTA